MDDTSTDKKSTSTEEIEICGEQLIEHVKGLLAEGKVRQLRIKAADGGIYLEMPLTIGVIAGGAVVLAAPWLAVLGAIAAFISRVRLEIVRDAEPPKPTGSGGKEEVSG
jgi:Domain of unknown function (DUF4342)